MGEVTETWLRLRRSLVDVVGVIVPRAQYQADRTPPPLRLEFDAIRFEHILSLRDSLRIRRD